MLTSNLVMEELFLRLLRIAQGWSLPHATTEHNRDQHFKICEDADHKSNSARRRCARGPGQKHYGSCSM